MLTDLVDAGELALLAAEDLRPAWHGALLDVGVGVEVLDVALEPALRARRVVAVRAVVLEVDLHVRVELLLHVACRKICLDIIIFHGSCRK